MSYPELVDYGMGLQARTTAQQTALNLAATAAQYVGFAVLRSIQVTRINFFVITATTTGLVAPVLNVTSRPTYGSATNGVTLGAITIPTASAIGTLVYKDLQTKQANIVNAGYELSLNVLSAGTDSGTATGVGWFTIEWQQAVDSDANQTLMVKSV